MADTPKANLERLVKLAGDTEFANNLADEIREEIEELRDEVDRLEDLRAQTIPYED